MVDPNLVTLEFGSSAVFRETIARLDAQWRNEARFRLLLLSILIALLILSCLVFYASPIFVEEDKEEPRQGSVGSLGFIFLIATLRILPEMNRSRIRIAELQNASNAIQLLAERIALKLSVSESEIRQVFEAASKLARVTGRFKDPDNDQSWPELLTRLLSLGIGKRNDPPAPPAP